MPQPVHNDKSFYIDYVLGFGIYNNFVLIAVNESSGYMSFIH